MHADSSQPGRCLLAAVAGLGCVMTPRLVHRSQPQLEPLIICVILDVELVQRNAVPPRDRSPSMQNRRVVIADLLSVGSRMPDCGSSVFETTMVFSDIAADSATLRVRVPCAEMPRPMYSQIAGDAPRLREQGRYRLELSGPGADDTAGRSESLWRAERIDVVHEPIAQRPAIADRMCHDVWGPSCRRTR